MKKMFVTMAVTFMVLFAPCKTSAEVTATILEQQLTPSVPDVDNNNRIYASVSYKIKVEGAEGHTLRVEIPWMDMNGSPVYFNIDNGETALSNQSYSIEASTDTIVGWCGSYHDAFWLKPGVHKLNGTIRVFDETLGHYVTLNGAKKLSFSFTSKKKAPGALITNCYLEHNQYVNNSKVMYVRFACEMNWMKDKDIKYDVSLYKANGAIIFQKNGKQEKVTGILTPSYTFSTYSDRWAYFPYSGMSLPAGKTNCYALIRLYDAKTGKLLATSKKLDFTFSK